MSYDHEHKYFLFQVKHDYEPLPPEIAENAEGELENVNKNLYRKVEYAVLSCNCAAVQKVRVKEKDNGA